MRLRRPVLLLLSLAAVCACAGESRSVDSRQVVLEAGIGQSKADISETGIFLWSKGDSFTAFLGGKGPTIVTALASLFLLVAILHFIRKEGLKPVENF